MTEVEQQEEQEEDAKQEEAEDRASPSGEIVHKAILKEGEEELARPTSALFWSGLAAGLSMGFSLIGEAVLRAHLPDESWRPLVAKFGYSLGFLIVILGRQQLFTENTLTPILPLLDKKEGASVGNVLRLWGIVLVANLIGGLALAFVVARTPALSPATQAACYAIGHEAMMHSFGVVLLKAIFAGWLIALMVWLLPFAETGRIWVIILLTYVIGVAGFSHSIAGSIEVFVIACVGQKGWLDVLRGFVVPALIGNIIGGVALVAALNHAQVVAGSGGEDV
jgi:formate-nitrite transporter family protein